MTGGGSGTGISALINGTTDICESSRSMKEAEKEQLRDRYDTTAVEIPVAQVTACRSTSTSRTR